MRASYYTQHDRQALQEKSVRLPWAQSVAVVALLSALSWGVVVSLVLVIVRAL